MVAWLGPALAAGASLLGTALGNHQREQGQQKEIETQKEFAQQGLRWRVEDAKAAGIHPVYALGFNGPTYSPVGLGSNDTAAGFSDAGQSISRAVDATRTIPEKERAYGEAMQSLGLDRAELENELLRSQIAQLRVGPAFPSVGSNPRQVIEGQGNSVVMRNPFGWGETTVATPELASESQVHFGEPGEWIYGGGNMLESWINSARADMQKGIDAKYGDLPPNVPRWY